MIRLLTTAWRIITAPVRYVRPASSALAQLLFSRDIRLAKTEGAFPKRLRSHTLYILTEDGTPWQGAMICPCGCGAVLDLNLLPDEKPCWRFSSDKKGRASLNPSVWRKVGCKSHFWLKSGKIIWV